MGLALNARGPDGAGWEESMTELVTEQRAAALLQVSVKCLQGWRPAVREARPVRALWGAGARGLRAVRRPNLDQRSGRALRGPLPHPCRVLARENRARADPGTVRSARPAPQAPLGFTACLRGAYIF